MNTPAARAAYRAASPEEVETPFETPKEIENSIADLNRLSLNAPPNWVANSGPKRDLARREGLIDDMFFSGERSPRSWSLS
jgi:hypothetical protein